MPKWVVRRKSWIKEVLRINSLIGGIIEVRFVYSTLDNTEMAQG